MAMLTLRLPRRLTLILDLVVFAFGHVVVALGSNVESLLFARFLTALATGAFWAAVVAVVASKAVGPEMGLVNAGGMLATVIGVPLGTLAVQLIGCRGTFWALGALALIVIAPIGRHVPRETHHQREVSVRSELSALRNGRLWLGLVGLGANPVLISLAVRFAGKAPRSDHPSASPPSTSEQLWDPGLQVWLCLPRSEQQGPRWSARSPSLRP
ncbi:MFS transporter [bacterium RCC_150]